MKISIYIFTIDMNFNLYIQRFMRKGTEVLLCYIHYRTTTFYLNFHW